MRHRLHTDHVATSLEVDGLQMLRCQPGRADDLLLRKQPRTHHVAIALQPYRFRFKADLLETFGIVILRLRRIVRHEEQAFALKTIGQYSSGSSPSRFSTCPVR